MSNWEIVLEATRKGGFGTSWGGIGAKPNISEKWRGDFTEAQVSQALSLEKQIAGRDEGTAGREVNARLTPNHHRAGE